MNVEILSCLRDEAQSSQTLSEQRDLLLRAWGILHPPLEPELEGIFAQEIYEAYETRYRSLAEGDSQLWISAVFLLIPVDWDTTLMQNPSKGLYGARVKPQNLQRPLKFAPSAAMALLASLADTHVFLGVVNP